MAQPDARSTARLGAGDIHSLQHSEFDCVWWTEPLDSKGRDGIPDLDSIEVARGLLDRLKIHADGLLRARGWRVKRLLEFNGGSAIGM